MSVSDPQAPFGDPAGTGAAPESRGMQSVGGSPPPRTGKVEVVTMKPVVTYTILAVTILVYIIQYFTQYYLGIDLPAALGVKANQAILQGQFWRLITPLFLHGSILHIGFNMYALYILGPSMERYYGRWRYLALYLLAGFAGNVASFLFTSANSLGSSTAIFGLLGAYGAFLYQNQGVLGNRARRGLMNIVLIAVINLAIGLTPNIGIDNWGHVGGLAGGTLFALLGGPKLKVEWAYPNVRLEDEREPGEVLRAGIWVALVFGGILAAAILARLR
jgi:rhomboid protease GluP